MQKVLERVPLNEQELLIIEDEAYKIVPLQKIASILKMRIASFYNFLRSDQNVELAITRGEMRAYEEQKSYFKHVTHCFQTGQSLKNSRGEIIIKEVNQQVFNSSLRVWECFLKEFMLISYVFRLERAQFKKHELSILTENLLAHNDSDFRSKLLNRMDKMTGVKEKRLAGDLTWRPEHWKKLPGH